MSDFNLNQFVLVIYKSTVKIWAQFDCWEKFVWVVVAQQNRVTPSTLDFGLGLWQKIIFLQIREPASWVRRSEDMTVTEGREKITILMLRWEEMMMQENLVE